MVGLLRNVVVNVDEESIPVTPEKSSILSELGRLRPRLRLFTIGNFHLGLSPLVSILPIPLFQPDRLLWHPRLVRNNCDLSKQNA